MKGARVEKEVRTFATTMEGLLALLQWLEAERCEAVAMESTGVYWKPLWRVLEGHFQVVLANAQEVRNLPGRKSDLQDAEWLADLLAHGLIRSSFVPPAPLRALRDLTRTRTQMTREVTRHTLRLQKTLEDANIKLTNVLTDILGVTGRAIVEALIAGTTDAEALVELRRKGVKASREEMLAALRGRLTDHHRFLLRLHLTQIDALRQAIAELDDRIREHLEPFRSQCDLLRTVPAMGEHTAAVILAEIGTEMRQFPTAGHLRSWSGLCPKSDQSAGKHRSRRLRRGNRWLKTALVQVAWAATRRKEGYHRQLYLGLKVRRGAKKAVVAVAASLLTSIYHVLLHSTPYQDPTPHDLTPRARQRAVNRLLRRLNTLGVEVEVKRAA
jgi:transposase